jgi:hypothetical protein
MIDKTKETETPTVEPFAGAGSIATGGIHKNAAIGPTTNKLLHEWRRSRDYEQFNPTPEK